jgi:hypothetical protein
MRLTTKYTYVYRVIGIVGCLMVLGSVFIPWVTIDGGALGDYEEGDSPTGWALANLEKGGNFEENIFAYLFMIVFAFLIFPIIGLILIALGRDARGIGYYITSMAIFFIILIIFLLPMIQGAIQAPSDPFAGLSTDEIEEIMNSNPEAYQKMVDEQEVRARIMAMKDVKMGFGLGLMLTIAGGIITYIGARLSASDAERVADLYKYFILLKEAHKDDKITKEAEDLLAMERRIYKITREEHEMILAKLFPDEREFRKALDMHDNPIDLDAKILGRAKSDYELLLREAHKDGRITKEEADLLKMQRKIYGISQREHEELLWKMFPNEKDFQYALFQHDKPVDMDRMLMDKELQDYEVFVAQAYRSGNPTDEEKEMLSVIRERLSISDEDHEMVMGFLLTEGKIKETVVDIPKVPPPPKWEEKPPDKKEKPKVRIEKKPEKKPGKKPEPGPPTQVGEVKGAVTKETPKPAAKTKPPAGPPKKETPKEKPPSKVKCTKCGNTIVVPDKPRPIKLECSKCGATGTIK